MNGKIIKDALILFLITVIAGLGLGAVYGITKVPIEKANYNIQQNAYRTVFPDAASFEDMDGFDSAKATDAACLLYTSPSPRDVEESRMPSSA